MDSMNGSFGFSEIYGTTEKWELNSLRDNSTAWENLNLSVSTSRTFQFYLTGLMTEEEADLVRFVALQIILPIICSVGLIANLLSIGVIYSTKDNIAFTCYLKALTLTDSVTLFCGLTRFLCDVISKQLPEVAPQIMVYSEYIVGFGLGTFSWNVSSYLIALMSLERFVAVVFPFHVKRIVLEKFPKAAIVAIFILQLVFRTPSFIWTEIVKTQSSKTNTTVYYIDYKVWAKELPLRKYVSLILVIFDMFVPIAIVIVANAVILVSIKIRKQTKIGDNDSSRATKQGTEQRRITVTLMVLSAFYLLSMTPNTTIYVLMIALPDFAAIRLREINLMNTISNISVLIICLNSANDSVIYILASRRFRQLFKTRYFSRCYGI